MGFDPYMIAPTLVNIRVKCSTRTGEPFPVAICVVAACLTTLLRRRAGRRFQLTSTQITPDQIATRREVLFGIQDLQGSASPRVDELRRVFAVIGALGRVESEALNPPRFRGLLR